MDPSDSNLLPVTLAPLLLRLPLNIFLPCLTVQDSRYPCCLPVSHSFTDSFSSNRASFLGFSKFPRMTFHGARAWRTQVTDPRGGGLDIWGRQRQCPGKEGASTAGSNPHPVDSKAPQGRTSWSGRGGRSCGFPRGHRGHSGQAVPLLVVGGSPVTVLECGQASQGSSGVSRLIIWGAEE